MAGTMAGGMAGGMAGAMAGGLKDVLQYSKGKFVPMSFLNVKSFFGVLVSLLCNQLVISMVN